MHHSLASVKFSEIGALAGFCDNVYRRIKRLQCCVGLFGAAISIGQ